MHWRGNESTLIWDVRKSYVYQFHVYTDGSYIFKNPYLSNTQTRLERVLGGQKNHCKCYFVGTNANASFDQKKRWNVLFNNTTHQARSLLIHAHHFLNCSSPSFYQRNVELDDQSSVHIERIEDFPYRVSWSCVLYDEHGKPRSHTDGTCFISKDMDFK